MYDFHYDFIKKHFDAELLFTKTDSLTYETQPEGVYPKDSKFLHPVNEKVIGKMKNEHEG